MFTSAISADGVIFDAARQAGFEDGIDFVVSQGPSSCSPRMIAWLSENKVDLTLKAFEAWTFGQGGGQ